MGLVDGLDRHCSRTGGKLMLRLIRYFFKGKLDRQQIFWTYINCVRFNALGRRISSQLRPIGAARLLVMKWRERAPFVILVFLLFAPSENVGIYYS